MGHVIGVTATRRGLTDAQINQLVGALTGRVLRDAREGVETYLHHGACVGGDEECVRVIAALRRIVRCQIRIVAHPGQDRPDLISAEALALSDTVRGLRPNLRRNRAIVDEVVLTGRAHGIVLAFPAGPDEVRRGSGTWATVRYARRVQAALRIIYPDGRTGD